MKRGVRIKEGFIRKFVKILQIGQIISTIFFKEGFDNMGKMKDRFLKGTAAVLSVALILTASSALGVSAESGNLDESAIEFTCANNLGGASADKFYGIAETSDGGYVAAGTTFGDSEDPEWSLTGGSSQDGLIVKFDAEGNVEWAQTYGTEKTDYFLAVTQIADGTIVAAGITQHAFTEGASATASGYLVKVNPEDGTDYEEVWVGGDSKGDYLTDVTSTADGGYAVCGYSSSKSTGIWEGASPSALDSIIVKYNANGEVVFGNATTSGDKTSRFYSVDEDEDGNLIAVGQCNPVSFKYNAQIIKFDGTTGDVLARREAGVENPTPGSSSADEMKYIYKGVTSLQDGTYVAVGYESDSAETEEGWELADGGVNVAYAVRYSSDLETVISTQSFSSERGECALMKVESTNDGGYLLIGGSSAGSTDNYDFYWGNYGGYDGILIKMNADDEIIWAQNYGTNSEDEFNDAVVRDNGDVAVVGFSMSFEGTPEWGNNGSEDAIICIYDAPEVEYPVLSNEIAYIDGYDDDTVRPDSEITRAEVAKILYTLIEDENKDAEIETTFTDIEEGDWYYQAIAYAGSIELLDGYEDGKFRPEDNISREEYVTIIGRLGEMEVGETDFTDLDDTYAKESIESAYIKGYVDGYDDDTFRPKNNITRGEAVKIMNLVIGRSLTDEELETVENLFTDLEDEHWAYSYIMAAATEIGQEI